MRKNLCYNKDGHVSRRAVEALRYIANLKGNKARVWIPAKYKQSPLSMCRNMIDFLGIDPNKKYDPNDVFGDYLFVSDEQKEKAKAALKELESDIRKEWLV